MAIEVKALLGGSETAFVDVGNNTYEAIVTAPNRDGPYEITINAVSSTGDTDSASIDLKVSSWIEPKVDWKSTDRFNIKDFNRIRNNIISIQELLSYDYGQIPIESMGEELTDYAGYWNVDFFNAFEKNVEIFYEYLPVSDFGTTQKYYVNGLFIKYDELNRIENLLLRFKDFISYQNAGVRKLPFRLGAFKEVRL